MTTRNRQCLDLCIVLVEEVFARPTHPRASLPKKIKDVLGDGVPLRRVLGCCRQVELQGKRSDKGAALRYGHLLGDGRLESYRGR